jgi:hypothetical protein
VKIRVEDLQLSPTVSVRFEFEEGVEIRARFAKDGNSVELSSYLLGQYRDLVVAPISGNLVDVRLLDAETRIR